MATLIAIGGAAMAEGRLPAAAESDRELVDTRNADLRSNFGTILARTGDVPGAIAQFEAALRSTLPTRRRAGTSSGSDDKLRNALAAAPRHGRSCFESYPDALPVPVKITVRLPIHAHLYGQDRVQTVLG